jgi:uncharacterized protein YyaL (SSP411 family)
MTRADPPLVWIEWGTPAFSRASRDGRPVFLYLTAVWSAACRHVEQHVFASPALQILLQQHFVPVRVDVDLRPDIAQRYGLGRWPSLLVLTPEGDVLTGGCDVQTAHLTQTLTRLIAVFGAQRRTLLETAAADRAMRERHPASDLGPLEPRDVAALAAALGAAADGDAYAANAGFGDLVLIQGLLALGARCDNRPALRAAARVLERLVAAGMLDGDVDSPGAAHAADDAGADTPSYARLRERLALLDGRTRAIEVLLDANTLLARPELGARAHAQVRSLMDSHAHRAGGFAYASAAAPLGDSRRFVSANALAARALFSASRLLDVAAWGELAVRTLEDAVLPGYQRGTGLAHVLDPDPRGRGLLVDQVTASAALVAAFDATNMRVYLDLAEELMRLVLSRYWDPEVGAMMDHVPTSAGAGDVGLLAQRIYPVDTNCLGARVLAQLGRLLEDPSLTAAARQVVAGFGASGPSGAADMAHYVLAALEVA